MSEVQHTPEPWHVFDKNRTVAVMNQGNFEIIGWTGFDSSSFGIPTQKANARRIVAAVNACRGLDTSVLESLEGLRAEGKPLVEWVGQQLRERERLTRERDEARAMVKELAEYVRLTTDIVPGSFASILLAKAEALS